MSAAAVGDMPDVVSLTGDGNLYMAERGLFLPIDELMGDEWEAFKEWAMLVVWEVNDWKGHVWALTPTSTAAACTIISTTSEKPALTLQVPKDHRGSLTCTLKN